MTDHATGAKPHSTADESLSEMRAFHARMEEDRRKRLEAATAERAALLTLLIKEGVASAASRRSTTG